MLETLEKNGNSLEEVVLQSGDLPMYIYIYIHMECGCKIGYANAAAVFANENKTTEMWYPSKQKNKVSPPLVKPIEITHPDLSTKIDRKWLLENGLASVSRVVCEVTSQRMLRLEVDGEMLIGEIVVCEYTTGRYAKATRTNLEKREHARARRKTKQYEGNKKNSRNTKGYK